MDGHGIGIEIGEVEAFPFFGDRVSQDGYRVRFEIGRSPIENGAGHSKRIQGIAKRHAAEGIGQLLDAEAEMRLGSADRGDPAADVSSEGGADHAIGPLGNSQKERGEPAGEAGRWHGRDDKLGGVDGVILLGGIENFTAHVENFSVFCSFSLAASLMQWRISDWRKESYHRLNWRRLRGRTGKMTPG